MDTNLSVILRQIVSGDLTNLGVVLETDHSALVEAAARTPGLCLRKDAALKVLLCRSQGIFSDAKVQQWASFVRRGYCNSITSDPIRPIDIELDTADEDLLANIVSRLDEIGDEVAGKISNAELSEMIKLLKS